MNSALLRIRRRGRAAAERDERKSRELLVAQCLADGSNQVKSGQPLTAIETLTRAIALDPQNAEAYESVPWQTVS